MLDIGRLLVLLWVRSYRRADVLLLENVGQIAASMEGRVNLGGSGGFSPAGDDDYQLYPFFNYLFELNSVRIKPLRPNGLNPAPKNVSVHAKCVAPDWLLAVICTTLATVPWLRWQFSLRTLLIATTLVAIALGLIVALI